MSEVNPKNARLIMEWVEELDREYSTSTVDQKLAAMAIYEKATAFTDFTAINLDHVDTFIAAIRNKSVLSRTRASTVRHVKGFFEWMVMMEKIKGKQARMPLKALKLPKKDRRAGQASKRKPRATIAQIISTMQAMPKTNAIERRNRALIAFTALSGARDGAIISMHVGHVDLANCEVLQHPDEVETKASKQIFTWFFPVGNELKDEVVDYIGFLKHELGFIDSDPLFPQDKRGRDENDHFTYNELSKQRWANAQPMRDIFKKAFQANALKYFNPHSFRNTLMDLAYDLGLAGEALKAWSQNLGHEKLDTTVNAYGNVSLDRQRAVIMSMHERPNEMDDENKPITVADFKRLIESGAISVNSS